ncbi:MAG: SagB/ThcOx family dehydrogenase [Patescibacteria group bacterium]|nr:SagB/ThcOx family dehydrogenase [Patescibacteria group bacterium]
MLKPVQKSYLFERFHNKSSIDKLKKTLPKELWPESWKRIYFKGYPRFERISLPNPKSLKDNNSTLYQLITTRKSERENHKVPLSMEQISSLLVACSITNVYESVYYNSYRAYPSAGARYPLEIYLIINKPPKELKSGLYHYHVRTHSLEYLWNTSAEEIRKCFPGQKFVQKGRIIVIITGIMSRLTSKYFERSYRYALIESGHVCQNFYLIGEAIGQRVCAIGGFNDQNVKNLLDINVNKDEIPIYCISIP